MKVICDIPDDVYTRLFDNGLEATSVKDIIEINRAIRNGVVVPNDGTIWITKGTVYSLDDKRNI